MGSKHVTKSTKSRKRIFAQCGISKSGHYFTYWTCGTLQGTFSAASSYCWLFELCLVSASETTLGAVFWSFSPRSWDFFFFVKLIIVSMKFWVILSFLENAAYLLPNYPVGALFQFIHSQLWSKMSASPHSCPHWVWPCKICQLERQTCCLFKFPFC